MTRLKGLGRGLDALLAGTDVAEPVEALRTLALDRIQPGKYQPRTHMDDGALEELSASGLAHDAAAKAVGRSRSAVSNLLRLRELAKPVQAYLMNAQLDMGHARALLALPTAQQTGAAARVVAQRLSVRETEKLVHQ